MSITEFFPSPKEESLLRNSFSASAIDLDLLLLRVEELIDIAADINLSDTSKPANVSEIWSLLRCEYPEIAKNAVQSS
jgi:hypothetical protein